MIKYNDDKTETKKGFKDKELLFKLIFDLTDKFFYLEKKIQQKDQKIEELILLKEKVNSFIFLENRLQQQQEEEQQQNIDKNFTFA